MFEFTSQISRRFLAWNNEDMMILSFKIFFFPNIHQFS